MPYFFSFFDIGRQAALTCYIPTSDTSCFRCGSGIKKTVSLYFGFFFSFSLSCTGLNMKLLQCSRYRFQHRGQFPCISLSPSFCPASSSCTPPPLPLPHLPPASLCLSDWREGWLTRLQQCSLIISLHHSDKPQPHIPSNLLTPSTRHTPLL